MSEIFSGRLKKGMAIRGKKAIDVAINCGFSRGMMSNYLKGKRTPKMDRIQSIASYLEVSPAYLMGLTDDMFFEPKVSNFLPDNVNVPLLNEIEKNLLKLDEPTLKMVCEMVKALVKKQ